MKKYVIALGVIFIRVIILYSSRSVTLGILIYFIYQKNKLKKHAVEGYWSWNLLECSETAIMTTLPRSPKLALFYSLFTLSLCSALAWALYFCLPLSVSLFTSHDTHQRSNNPVLCRGYRPRGASALYASTVEYWGSFDTPVSPVCRVIFSLNCRYSCAVNPRWQCTTSTLPVIVLPIYKYINNCGPRK